MIQKQTAESIKLEEDVKRLYDEAEKGKDSSHIKHSEKQVRVIIDALKGKGICLRNFFV